MNNIKILNHIPLLIKNKLLASSFIVLAGSLVTNICNYIFNVVMGRMLTPEEFGSAAAIFSLTLILGVPSTTLINILSKYIAQYKSNPSITNNLYYSSRKFSLSVGLITLIIFWILTPVVSDYLKIELLPLIIFGLFLPSSLLSSVNVGALQGLHQFIHAALISTVIAIAKLALGIIAVLLGFSVSGVIGGFVIATIVAYLYGYVIITRKFNTKKAKLQKKTSTAYSIKKNLYKVQEIFWATLCIAIFGNIDLILAKLYLSPNLAGEYAALSVAGKIITYAAIALNNIMLPLISSVKNNEPHQQDKILRNTIIFISSISSIIVIIYTIFPTQIIQILFGSKYLSIVPYLSSYGLAMLCNTLAIVLTYYFIAVSAKGYLTILIIGTGMQILLISIHNQTLGSITQSLLASSILMFAGMALLYFHRKNSFLKTK